MTSQPPNDPWGPRLPHQPPYLPPHHRPGAFPPGQPVPLHKRTWFIVTAVLGACGLVFGGCIALLAASSPSSSTGGDNAAARISTTSRTAATTTTAAAGAGETTTTAAPPTTAAPATTKPPSQAALLRAAIASELGDSNRNVQRLKQVTIKGGVATVRWAIDDNLTEGLIRTGARIDTLDILKAVRARNKGYGAHVIGTFPLTDAYGNTAEEVVVNLTYTAATLQQINFDGISHRQIFDIADAGSVHPEMQG